MVRRVAARFAIAVGAIVLLSLVLEAALAVAKITSRSITIFDWENGQRFVPGARYVNREEGVSEGRFNSHGSRDVERTWAKPPNTYRIVVLGDSFVESFNLPRERTFLALLEAALNARSHGMRFEVLPLGPGSGTADAYMRYRNVGVRYSPDMVILAYFMGNDVRDNSKVLNLERMWFYFVPDASGNVVIDRSTLDRYARQLTPRRRVYQAIKRRSYLLSLIAEQAYLLRREFRERRLRQAYANPTVRTDLDEFSELNVFLPDPTPRWTEAWDITEKALVTLAREVEGNDSRFVLMTIGAAEQIHSKLQEEIRRRYPLPFDFDLPDRRLRTFAARHGISMLDLTPPFRNYHRRTGVFLYGHGTVVDGHWTETGHRLATQEILAFLETRYGIPQGSE